MPARATAIRGEGESRLKKHPARVTVLMPVYNGEKHLSGAIESILGQTFPDFEFLVIDDGSTDSSRRIDPFL